MNPSETPLYNLAELQSLAGDDEAFFREMISLFIEQNETGIVDINNEISHGNHGKVTGILHKMKPSIIVMGVKEVAELIKKVESLEVKPENELPFREMAGQIVSLLIRVNEQLKQL